MTEKDSYFNCVFCCFFPNFFFTELHVFLSTQKQAAQSTALKKREGQNETKELNNGGRSKEIGRTNVKTNFADSFDPATFK